MEKVNSKNNIILLIVVSILIILALKLNYMKDDFLNHIGNHEDLKRHKEYETEDIIRVYKDKNGKVLQIVTTQGYKSEITFLVEIDQSAIENVEIISQHETKDYGSYVTENWFLDRLKVPIDREIEVVKMAKKDENQVVAITGATITSEAVVKGLNQCVENYGRIENEKK